MFEQILESDIHSRRYLIGALEIFMRILGALLLLIGISHCMEILGMVINPASGFLEMSTQQRVVVVFFTIFNLTAAVGLWNKMSWGIVVWLITVGVDIFLQLFFSSTFGLSPISLFFHIITVGVYATLATLIHRTKPS